MIEQGFCPRCGRPNCTTHPQKGTTMVQFGERTPLQPGDSHEVIIQDITNIIAKYAALGLTETVEIYQDALAKFTGEHPTKLF